MRGDGIGASAGYREKGEVGIGSVNAGSANAASLLEPLRWSAVIR